MTAVGSGELVAAAASRRGAVAALNVITLEHAEAIVAGAMAAERGVILQVSQNAVRFHGGDPAPILAGCRELAAGAGVPVAIHLDHVDDPELLAAVLPDAHRLGVGSVMVDFAALDIDANVRETAAWTRRAHDAGLWVEAELGEVGGKDGAHAPAVRTDPDEAAAFVASTGVDALAVAVGSSHAMAERTAELDLELIARLAAAVPVPLVLHGSSGVPATALRRAVDAGIRKVNIGTALNVAGTAAMRSALAARPDAVDPRPVLAAVRDAMAAVARVAITDLD